PQLIHGVGRTTSTKGRSLMLALMTAGGLFVCLPLLNGAVEIAAPMTPERVNAAIAWGTSLAHRKTEDPFDAYSLGARERVNVTTPFLRVALAARRAAEDGRQFTAADVTPEMIKPVLVVYAPGNLIGPLLPPEIAGIDDYTEAVDVDALYILRADG